MTQPSTPLFPADNPAVVAHVNVLQGVINRLAGNSSSCKTWCLALVSALLSLAGATHNLAIVSFALVPVVMFGFLDTMYLAQEKAYRDLYGTIVTAAQGGKYDRACAFKAEAVRTRRHVMQALRSWSIWPIYGGLIVAYVAAERSGWLDLLATVQPAKS